MRSHGRPWIKSPPRVLNWVIKIADFGLSSMKGQLQSLDNNNNGKETKSSGSVSGWTTKWAPPDRSGRRGDVNGGC